MKSFNKFSIIIISYNNKNGLELTLDSLNHIHYPEHSHEIIVVDDGSQPPLYSSLDCAINPLCQFIYIPRSSTSSRSKARNTGAASANNEWLVFIDGDQYVNPDLLVNYNNAINKHTELTALLGTRIDLTEWQSSHLLANKNYSQLQRITRTQQDFRNSIKAHFEDSFPDILGTWILFWSHNFTIKRTSFLQIGGFDENFLGWGCEDVEVGYRLTKNKLRFDFLENHVFHLYEPNKFNLGKYLNSLANAQYFYEKYRDVAIMFKVGFYESFFNADTNQINHDLVLRSFLLFNRKLIYLQQGEADIKS